MLDGSVENRGVPRYRAYNGKHLQTVDKGTFDADGTKGTYITVK